VWASFSHCFSRSVGTHTHTLCRWEYKLTCARGSTPLHLVAASCNAQGMLPLALELLRHYVSVLLCVCWGEREGGGGEEK